RSGKVAGEYGLQAGMGGGEKALACVIKSASAFTRCRPEMASRQNCDLRIVILRFSAIENRKSPITIYKCCPASHPRLILCVYGLAVFQSGRKQQPPRKAPQLSSATQSKPRLLGRPRSNRICQ